MIVAKHGVTAANVGDHLVLANDNETHHGRWGP